MTIKYFVCSDIHGGYSLWIKALEESGWDRENEDHKIILCGDLFDRLGEAQKCYDFALELLKEDKLIYIKGNHEDLLRDLLDRQRIEYHDVSNRTDDTVWQLADKEDLFKIKTPTKYREEFKKACSAVDIKYRELEKYMVPYYETEKYIFVHSWIPTTDGYEYDPDWRQASEEEWKEARWANPFDRAQDCLNQTGKTLVFGHWHTSYYWAGKEGRSEFGTDARFDIAYDDEHHTIGLDGCTSFTGRVNVMVVEEETVSGIQFEKDNYNE